MPRLVENGFYPANPHPGFEKSLAIIAKKNADFTSLSLSFLDLLCFFLHFKAHSYRSARPSEDDYLRLAMNSEESVERFSFAADGGVTLGGC